MDPPLNNITPTSSMSNMEQFPPSTDPLPIQWPHESALQKGTQCHGLVSKNMSPEMLFSCRWHVSTRSLDGTLRIVCGEAPQYATYPEHLAEHRARESGDDRRLCHWILENGQPCGFRTAPGMTTDHIMKAHACMDHWYCTTCGQTVIVSSWFYGAWHLGNAAKPQPPRQARPAKWLKGYNAN